MDFRQIRRDLGRKLAAGEPYLWIVDDLPPGLDQEQGIPGWCAPSANGRTLITTHSKDYAGLGVTIEIDVLETEPAWELLTPIRSCGLDTSRNTAWWMMRGEGILRQAVERLGLSARACHRILKVARTVADLDHEANIAPHHVLEAIQHRTLFWIDA